MKRATCLAIAALAAPPGIAGEILPTLTPRADGGPACYSQEISLYGGRPLLAKLCVLAQSSIPTQYYAEIEDKLVMAGTDDEIAEGVSGSFQDTPLTLRCLPAAMAAGRKDCSLRVANLLELMRVAIEQP